MATWVSTTLRIKDPAKSVPFYESNFKMKLAAKIEGAGETRYFLVRPRDDKTSTFSSDAPGSDAARRALFTRKCNYVELWHTHGSEGDAKLKYDNGNVEPTRGFGHIAFNTADVQESCDSLEAAGVDFQKKPSEGKMKTMAFVKDPDSYWIEIVRRLPETNFKEEFNLSQTMIRVKDPAKSIAFYTGHLGMRLISARHFSDFSLFFLASLSPGDAPLPPFGAERDAVLKNAWGPVLELTHNHGTEHDEAFSYHSGNADPLGFSSIGFVTQDLAGMCALLKHDGAAFADAQLASALGAVPGKVEVALDPDGYAVKLIAKGAVL
ncbi:Lactoylglutathione lyase, related [Tribonema minus]|uniref:Lactoylglutathione lyase, related n=1 Tax=Tribonema minus TaxID=303371 RepID=A0A835Z416_9STRA|nr:Lactoylglutathione lyase, related [Tribonema minus]